MLESEFEYPAAEETMDSYICVDPLLLGKNNNGNKKRKRFSDEQIKSLECIFESQTRFERRKKLQLARELGLQPRQVAIWFQNKRARWKSKQLEREYGALRADYDALLSSFESVKMEKQSLLKQLQQLTDLLGKSPQGNNNNKAGGDSDNRNTPEGKEDRKASCRVSTEGTDIRLMMCSGGEENVIYGYSEKHEPDLLCMGEPADGSLRAANHHLRCSFDTSVCFSDQSGGGSSQWWEFWPLNE